VRGWAAWCFVLVFIRPAWYGVVADVCGLVEITSLSTRRAGARVGSVLCPGAVLVITRSAWCGVLGKESLGGGHSAVHQARRCEGGQRGVSEC
jgi:hypothetical protein